MTLLKVDELQVIVRGGMAVDGVSLTLGQGEVLALMGESGAGKSLTAAAIVGLLPPGSRMKGGIIAFKGKRIDQSNRAGWRKLRGKHICAVFQDPYGALDPLQTIGVQLTQTLRTHQPQLTRALLRDRVAEWLEAVSLSADRASAYPHELSGGMRQRVALALAMAPGPEILIADEPAAALDMPLRAQLAGLMRRLAQAQNTSVLLISHDIRTALAAADRVAVMYAGRVLETGPAAAVLQSPRHPYVAGLIASMPGLAERKHRLPVVSGRMPLPGTAPRGCVFRQSCHNASDQCRAERPAQPASGAACFHPLPELADAGIRA